MKSGGNSLKIRLSRKTNLDFVPACVYSQSDGTPTVAERVEPQVDFYVHKFTARPRPAPSQCLVVSAFSEFGCETLLPLYFLPYLLHQRAVGRYCIVIGWYGREFLYRHLVDEYWETKPEHQWLRDYCLAFHHQSRNLTKIERHASQYGKLIDAKQIGHYFTFPRLNVCNIARDGEVCNGRILQFSHHQQCQKCDFVYKPPGLFTDCVKSKRQVKWLPPPCDEKMEIAKRRLPPNPVGVVARNRKTYGRNLTPEFYVDLVRLIQSLGYNPVWMGEKASAMACPLNDICDLSNERDFEQTLAYVSQMAFTIQFFTASTRLAGYVGTPAILFESPDQIWCGGQEGMRLYLTSKGGVKLVASHFNNLVEDQKSTLGHVEQAIQEVREGNFNTIMGLVDVEKLLMLKNSRKCPVTWF